MSVSAQGNVPNKLNEANELVDQTPVECREELIRLPGAIQQYGFFLLTDGALEQVVAASENAERFLGLPLRLILGSRLDLLIERELRTALAGHMSGAERQGLVTFVGSYQLRGELYSVTTHCIGEHRAIEFERQDRLVGAEMMNSVITNFVGTLSRVGTEQELCDELTRQVEELTGFDRVLLYSFDDEGHGTVLSERNNGRLPSYLGLRFPSSDIPQQARELYVLNTVRIIPDAMYEPSPVTGLAGLDASKLDLSLSTLRSVSPVHLEYMRNMGTISSMSVSLVTEGRLWGLISGHHAEAKVVPFLVRSACDMLSRMASTQLAAFQTATRLRETVHLHAVQRRVLTAMAAEPEYMDGLTQELPALLDVTRANGVALIYNDRIQCTGHIPSEEAISRLAEWLDDEGDFEIWHSSHLGADVPARTPADAEWANAIVGSASGVIAARMPGVRQRYVMWFRPEVVRTVRWAGEPGKIEDNLRRLHPRHSFEEWKEIVHGRSAPWSPVEIDSAREFRAALTTIGLRRAEEAVELGEARFQRLTSTLPVRVFTADDTGRLTYTSDRWGAGAARLKGRWFEEAELCEDDARLCAELWQQAVAANRPFEAEVRLKSQDGQSARWNMVRVAPFQRTGGRRAGWVGCFIDLTDAKERETALRMSEKLALTGRMTSVIAHEINNPLEAITNLMYLLRAETRNDGPAASYIGMVESELERISGITKQTLRWNRESSDRAEDFHTGPMIDDVLRLFAGKIRNRQIAIHIEGDRDTPMWGVLGQLRQVLANLVSNAVDASPIGGVVDIRSFSDGDGTGFAVEDNGRGIPSETLRRLFEPFFSTKGDLGNGLGLYISKEIVERHGGRIDVESQVGQGTTMTVWLPKQA